MMCSTSKPTQLKIYMLEVYKYKKIDILTVYDLYFRRENVTILVPITHVILIPSYYNDIHIR